MDVGLLRERISATLDANTDIRRQAELDLKYVCFVERAIRALRAPSFVCSLTLNLQAEDQPGFLNALLDILQGEQINTIRLSSETP